MNHITIEFCAEDRARIERLTARMEQLIEAMESRTCDRCVRDALAWSEQVQRAEVIGTQQAMESDALQQKLAETLAKANAPAEKPTETAEAPKAEPAPIDHPAAESLPGGDPAPADEAKPTITQEQLQQKITQLAAAKNGALKVKVREIVTAYAPKVSELPEDKWPEIWAKLAALEKEV